MGLHLSNAMSPWFPLSFFNNPIGLSPVISSHYKTLLLPVIFLLSHLFESCHFQRLFKFHCPSLKYVIIYEKRLKFSTLEFTYFRKKRYILWKTFKFSIIECNGNVIHERTFKSNMLELTFFLKNVIIFWKTFKFSILDCYGNVIIYEKVFKLKILEFTFFIRKIRYYSICTQNCVYIYIGIQNVDEQHDDILWEHGVPLFPCIIVLIHKFQKIPLGQYYPCYICIYF